MSERREGMSINFKSSMNRKQHMLRVKGAELGNKNQLTEQLKEQEMGHEFLQYEKLMQAGKERKEYGYDHARIKAVQAKEEELRKRMNQYQAKVIQEDKELAHQLGIDNFWDFQASFKHIRLNLPERNKIFNSHTIEQYINKAFEVKAKTPKKKKESLDRFILPVLISPKSPKIVSDHHMDNSPVTRDERNKHGLSSVAMEIVKVGNSTYKTEKPRDPPPQ